MKRTFMSGAVAGIAALGFGIGLAAEARAADLTVVTWGGAQETGYKKAYGETYEKLSGNKLTWTTWNGTISFIRAQVESKSVSNHIYPLNPWDTVAGCDEGLLEKIDPKEMGITDPSDFYEGAIEPCGIGIDIWTYLLAWNLDRNPTWVGDKAPKDVQSMFDLKTWPGRRGIRKRAYGALEYGIMGDGVPNKDVYKVLATPEGIKRALAKLDTVKKNTLFLDNVPQMPQALADGETDYTSIVNSRFYYGVVTDKKKFATNWKDQIYSYNTLSIPKNNPRLKEAKEYIKNAIKPENMAESGNLVAYPPSRKSALKLVKADVQQHLATAHFEGNNSLSMDARFWAEYLDAYAKSFQNWLAQ
ncbi:MAG: extracellular solute-binding protein [Rhodospirillales bacterium]|nr:extracellular solute-binding protein [Rhodospirillales bacterium]